MTSSQPRRRGDVSTSLASRRSLRVGTWNVRTFAGLDSARLLVRELTRLRVEFAGLQEVRMPNSGANVVDGYNILHSGRADGKHFQGVALVLSRKANSALISWEPVSERILQARIRHTFGVLHVVVCYGPTDGADIAEKDRFFDQLSDVIKKRKKGDTPIVLGDLNATVGTARDGVETALGPWGHDHRNDNGERLLRLCVASGLTVAGSWFRRSLKRRLSWYSPDGKTKKELDHILVGTRHKLVNNCRVYRSAEFNTDHRLVVATIQVRMRQEVSRAPHSIKHDLQKLQTKQISDAFAVAVTNRFSALDDIGALEWEGFRDGLKSAADDVLGPAPRPSKKNWLSAEAASVIEERRRAVLVGKKRRIRVLERERRQVLARDQERRITAICVSLEDDLRRGHLRPAYKTIKELSTTSRHAISSVAAADGTDLEPGKQQLDRWKEYMQSLLNCPAPSTPMDTTGEIPLSVETPICLEPPSQAEIRLAVTKLKSRKAPGLDGLTPELLKSGGDSIIIGLESVFRSAWLSGVVPEDWRKGVIVPFWKGKGAKSDCNNYRGITLLSVPGKVFAHVLLQRVRTQLLATQRPEQSGFTPGRSTVDRILTLRVLSERRRAFNQPLFAAYVDLKKAFDSVDREALWRLLALRGIPEKIIQLIRALYTDTTSCVRVGKELTDFFPVATGVRQGCVLAPTAFNVVMDRVLQRTIGLSGCGASIGEESFSDLDFADDAALLAEVLNVLPAALSTFEEEAKPLGLQVSWTKTKIQSIGAEANNLPQSVKVSSGATVDVVDRFTYLGSDITCCGLPDADINKRIGMTWKALRDLNRPIWRCRHLTLVTKIRIYKALVLPVLLYGSETWTLREVLAKKLDAFGTKAQRFILGISWRAKVTNKRVISLTKLEPISTLVRRRQLGLFGHIARMEERQPPRRVLCARDGKDSRRPRGRPRVQWAGQVLSGLRTSTVSTAFRAARDRVRWRSMIREAT